MRPLVALLALTLPLVAAPVPKALKKPQSIEEYWYLTEAVENGIPQVMGNSYCRYTLIRGEKYASAMSGRPKPTDDEDFKMLDPDRPWLRWWQGRPSVFESDGDTLRGCFPTDGRKELTECKPGKGVTYYVYERIKE